MKASNTCPAVPSAQPEADVTQEPDTQLWAEVQTVPHAPQLLGSLNTFEVWI
jgi:hypothetical protein